MTSDQLYEIHDFLWEHRCLTCVTFMYMFEKQENASTECFHRFLKISDDPEESKRTLTGVM